MDRSSSAASARVTRPGSLTSLVAIGCFRARAEHHRDTSSVLRDIGEERRSSDARNAGASLVISKVSKENRKRPANRRDRRPTSRAMTFNWRRCEGCSIGVPHARFFAARLK
jgi:hypothetical protein